MSVPCVCGIDPGSKGAIAFYFPTHDRLAVEDMPMVGGKVDAAFLSSRILQFAPTMGAIEDVTSGPRKWGKDRVFTFGDHFGSARSAFAIAAPNVVLHAVPSRTWKTYLGLSSDKEASRALALSLWPDRADLFKRKKDEGRAEAALIALYASEFLSPANQWEAAE